MSHRDRFRMRAPRGLRRIAAAVLVLAWLAGAVRPVAGAGPDERPDRYPDLYTARVTAEDRADLEGALARAMSAMLVRLTGSRRPEESPGVREAVASPERFVQQYLFEPVEPGGAGHGLTVKFDPGAVDRLVEQLGLGRWSRVRPRVIVWLVVEDEHGRKSFVDSTSPAAAAIDDAARERGMPVILPLFDIEDRMTLPVSTLWGGFPEPIQRASRRYSADAVLAGRAYRGETGLWKARWTLFGDRTREFRTSGESLLTTVVEGMHEVVDRFAARFAMRGAAAASSRVPIAVDGVERLADYGRLLRYLASIDIVETVQVERVEGPQVRFVLEAKGGRAALAELIALGRTLVPAGDALDRAAGGEPRLEYRLR